MTQQEKPKLEAWRLPERLIIDLADVVRGVEETNVGICTKYLRDEVASATNGASRERSALFEKVRAKPDIEPSPDDEVLELTEFFDREECHPIKMFDVEKFIDRYCSAETDDIPGKVLMGWRKRIKRVHRVFVHMHRAGLTRSVAVLNVAYGHIDPSIVHWDNKSIEYMVDQDAPPVHGRKTTLASLVRYTDATEEVRRQLVRERVAHQKSLAESPATQLALRNCKEHLEEGAIECMNLFERRRLELPPDLLDFTRHREIEQYLDRQITSGDALTEVFGELRVNRMAGQSLDAWKRHYEERKTYHDSRRVSFRLRAKREACEMLTIASRHYHDAFQEVKRQR